MNEARDRHTNRQSIGGGPPRGLKEVARWPVVIASKAEPCGKAEVTSGQGHEILGERCVAPRLDVQDVVR